MSDNVKLTTGGDDLLDDCSNYDKNAYEKAANTVDVCICRMHEGRLEVLLIKRKYNPFKGKYAIPGGFVDIGRKESLEEAAVRELEEETGVKGVPVLQLRTYGDPERDPRDRLITTAYYALVRESALNEQIIEANDDAAEYGWFPLDDIQVEIAFDHSRILNDLLVRLQGRIFYTADAFYLVEEIFTMPELKDVYEAVLGRKLDNFSRKIKQIYKLELVAEKDNKKSVGRPAKKYRFMGLKDVF